MIYQRKKYAAWCTLFHAKRHISQAGMRRSTSIVLQTRRKESGRCNGRWAALHKHQPEKIWEL